MVITTEADVCVGNNVCKAPAQRYSKCSVRTGNKSSKGAMLEQFAFHPGPNKYTVCVGVGGDQSRLLIQDH